MSGVHFRYGPSGAKRWIACPGSLHGPQENGSSIYADEGTACHTLISECWLLGVDPETRIGEEVNGFEVTEEMVTGSQMFLDTLEVTIKELEEQDGGEVHCLLEHRMNHPELFEFGGTTDAVIWNEKSLRIIDYKYGIGVLVEPQYNEQLLCYGVLALATLKCNPDSVMFTIVQPRRSHELGPVRSWDASRQTVQDWGTGILEILKSDPEERFVAGSHCQFCPRKPHCPELQRIAAEMAEKDYAMLDSELTPEKAAEIMGIDSAVRGYLDAVEKWAHGQMDKGATVPGFKLVYAYGNRAYKLDDDAITKALKKAGIAKKDAFVTELKSPAQLEKVAGKDLVNTFCDRKLKGTTVVPVSDRREAVVMKTAAEVFSEATALDIL